MDVLRLASDELELELLPGVGGRWHRLRAFGHDLLRTPASTAVHAGDPFFWGAYVMAPWCNRLPAGPMEWGGRMVDLPSNFPDGTAIHGQVYDQPWELRDDGSLLIEAGNDGWPWRYRVTQRLDVSGPALRVELSVENLDQDPMPAGVGLHPWFTRPLDVAIDSVSVYPANVNSPSRPMPVRDRLDLRTLVTPSVGLDATWTSLGDPAVRLAWPTGLQAEMSLRDAASHVVLASPATPDATAVEAQSHGPDGWRRLTAGEAGAPAILEPGSALIFRAEMAFWRGVGN